MSGRGGLIQASPTQALNGLRKVDPLAFAKGVRDSYLWPALASVQDAVAFNPYSTTAAQQAVSQVAGPPAQYTEPINRIMHGVGQDAPVIGLTAGFGGPASVVPNAIGGLTGSTVNRTLKNIGAGGLSGFLGDVADVGTTMLAGGGLAAIPMAVGQEATEAVTERGVRNLGSSSMPWEMTRAEYQAANPHEISPGSRAESRASAFDSLPDDADVWVFHATDDKTADSFLKSGVNPTEKPWTLARERYASGDDATFSPGSGLSDGIYVGSTPVSVDGYGRRILAFRVKKSDISIPPEGQILGKKTTGSAIADSDAVVKTAIPGGNVFDVTEKGRSGRVAHEAFVRRAAANGATIPERVMADYPEIFGRGVR